jgi:aspartate aminotransferase
MRASVRAFATNSPWGHVEQAPADPIFGVNEAFKKDGSNDKVLLSVGAYRTDEGKPYILDCVRRAEEKILELGLDHEYAGIDGIASYKEKCVRVAFGNESSAVKEGRVASCQSISGTGSLRVGFEFLKQWYPNKDAKVYVPNPTWPTHRGIAEKAGFEWGHYRYYDTKVRGFDRDGMLEDLHNMPDEQIVLLHSCAHNPTGCDPTQDDWKAILDVVN